MKNFKLKWLLVLVGVFIASVNTAWAVKYQPTKGVSGGAAVYGVVPQGAVMQSTGMQSQQMMSGGAYNGTVYEPFSNATPSEANVVGSTTAKAPNGPRRAFDTTGDYGNSGESPVGEPWILLLFALGFMGIIFIRKRKLNQTTEMKSTNKFIATLALLFTLGVGQMWAGAGFWSEGAWNLKLYAPSTYNSDTWIGGDGGKNAYIDGNVAELGTITSFYLKGYWFNTWKDGSGNVCTSGAYMKYCIHHESVSESSATWHTETEYGSSGTTIKKDCDQNLLSDATLNGNYVMEFLFACQINKSSSSGCGNWEYLKNTHGSYSGQNYKITFSYYPNTAVTFGQSAGGTAYLSVGGSSKSSGDEITKGSTLNFTVSKNTGYRFDGWYTNSSFTGVPVSTNESYSTTAAGNSMELYAKFSKIDYSLSYSSTPTGCSSFTNLTSVTKNYQDAVTLSIVPDATHTIASVTTTPSTTVTKDGNNYSFSMPAENTTVTVTTAITNVVVTYDATTNGGTCATASQTKTYGKRYDYSEAMPTAVKNGYYFKGWYTAASGGTHIWGSDNVDELDGAITLYAQFNEPEISTVSVSPISVLPGDEIEVNVIYNAIYGHTPEGEYTLCCRLVTDEKEDEVADQPTFTQTGKDQFTFIAPKTRGWYKVKVYLFAGTNDCSSLESPLVYASSLSFWIVSTNTVTVTYECGSATVLPAKEIQVADVLSKAVSVTAPEIAGLTFDHWNYDDGVITPRNATNYLSNPISVTANAATTLTAVYNQNGYVYFKNTYGWEHVYFYRYTDRSYWGNTAENFGMGAHTGGDHPCAEGPIEMSLVAGTTDLYYCHPSSTPGTNQAYAFTDKPSSEAHFGMNPETGTIHILRIYTDFDATNHMIIPDPNETDDHTAYSGRTHYFENYCVAPSLMNWGWTLRGAWDGDEDNWTNRAMWYPFSTDKMGSLSFQTKRYCDAANFSHYIQVYDYPDEKGKGKNASVIDGPHPGPLEIGTGSELNITFKTNYPGEYKYNLTFEPSANQQGGFPGKIKLSVDYPVVVGDFRLVYTGGAHPHPGDVIKKRANGVDIVSMYVAAGQSAALKLQPCSAVGVDDVTWTALASCSALTYAEGVDFVKILSDGGAGTYNFTIEQDENGANPTVTKVEKYTGRFYIRTNCISNKWNYKEDKDAHTMTYSEYSTTLESKPYSHYYVKDIDGSSTSLNIKFTVANDYSEAITDTVVNGDASGTYQDLWGSETLNRKLNVRFTYNQETNKIWRAYTEGPQIDDYMMLRSGSKVYPVQVADPGYGDASSAIEFEDLGNWVYQVDVFADAGAYIKLTADMHTSTGGEGMTRQYLKGISTNGEDGNAYTSDDAVLLLGGSATKQHMRISYDFKTDRMITSWLPAGAITGNLTLNADVMLIREHQEAGQSITFANPAYTLSEVNTVYGVMKFNKETLNNPALSQFERDLFWISFPFNVNLSDVFGFGKYMQHWAIQYYDGKGRAKNGYWYDSPSNWKFVTSAMRDTFVLKANEGYVLALDLEELETWSSVWANDVTSIYLYFPSTTNLGTILEKNEKTVDIDQTGYLCTIDRRTDKTQPNTNKDRRVADSYWHCIGVPSFAGAEHAIDRSWIDYDVPSAYDEDGNVVWKTKNLPFLYRWDMSTNELFPVWLGAGNVTFQAMHAYLVQYSQPTITWTNVVVAQPAAIKARQTQQADYNLSLVLTRDEAQQDQTFIRLSDDENVTDNFEFNQDLSKENNRNKANIWTLTADQYPVAGNSMPFSAETKTIQVGVKIAFDGEYTFSMPEGTNGVGVVLIDNTAGTRTNLSLTDYTVNLTAGTYDGRFSLELSPIAEVPSGIEQTGADVTDSVRKVIVDGILYIVKDGKVFDARGNRVQ